MSHLRSHSAASAANGSMQSGRAAGPAAVLSLGAQHVQCARQIGRVRANELNPAAVSWMSKAELDRVQPLPRQPETLSQHRVRAIEPVADAWMPDCCHVHPDLVRAARLKPHVQETGSPERLQRVVMGDRRAPVRDDREPTIAGWVPADGGVDGAAQRIGMPLHQRVISLVYFAMPESLLERAVSGLALSYDHHTSSACVQAMHDGRPRASPGGS